MICRIPEKLFHEQKSDVQKKKTPKPKLVGFLQADLDEHLSEWSSSDCLRFYQVFINEFEGKNRENLRRQIRKQFEKHKKKHSYIAY